MNQQQQVVLASIIYFAVVVMQTLPILAQQQQQQHRQVLNITKNNSSNSNNKTNTTEPRETLLPVGKCQEGSSCKLRGRRRDLDVGPDRISCYCDQKCQLYDDCCVDSRWTESIGRRLELGLHKLGQRRSQWHCKRINNIFGDIVLRAGCSAEWFGEQYDLEMANLIRRRCEYVKDRGKQRADENDQAGQLDPVGMMMPITDLNSGVTYANSYCLRCNTLIGSEATEELKRRKLVYWSPLLECNFNTDSDERNTLYDLISSQRGHALKYSNKLNKWTIATNGTGVDNKPAPSPLPTAAAAAAASGAATTQAISSNKTNNNNSADEQRVCSIMPTIPDSVEHMIRYCKANLIRSCPPPPPPPAAKRTAPPDLSTTERQARLECLFGHQSITYSLTSKAVYYNQACAMCNNEKRFFCEPKSSRASVNPISKIQVQKPSGGVSIFAMPGDSEMIETTATTTADGFLVDELTNSSARANSQPESSISGSFSVLMDLYGSSQDETDILANLSVAASDSGSHQQQQQQQQQHLCPDPQTQVFDPFYLTCRDVVCGLNHKFVDGKCVDKFKPAMVYITDVCLVISITSLALYLILYALSTFDLRPLAVQLAQWEFEAVSAAAAAAATAEADQQQRESDLRGDGGGESKPATTSGKLTGKSRSRYHSKRHSRISNEGSTASGPNSTSSSSSAVRHSQSLSTRGVASLAGSLLAAYLLFMLGHQTETGIQVRRQPICAGLAAATYYCFLVAFCWMFLLSYDIWRTLRLATCQLRGPAMHSQSRRFLSYALLALILSALLVGLAVLVDQMPAQSAAATMCENHPQLPAATDHHWLASQLPPAADQLATKSSSSCAGSWWSHFVQVYKPKFGYQPGSCWFSNRRALALFFGLPVTAIMLANLIFFLHSSCMVIRTSSRSSRQMGGSTKSSSSTSSMMPDRAASQPKFVSLEQGLTNSNGGSMPDFAIQNSLTTSSVISVQTLQSHLSASSSNASTTSTLGPALDGAANANLSPPPPPPDGAVSTSLPGGLVQQPASASAPKHAKLDSSFSSNSLATNHSTCSSSHSIASSLAIKYDSHLQSLQSMMGSIIKDYRLYCRLSTIMGLTWLTGLLASLVDQSETLWYLFVILNTLQGLFIFIAFGCKRSKLSNLELLVNYLKFWLAIRCCCSWCGPKPTKDSSGEGHSRQDSLSSASSD